MMVEFADKMDIVQSLLAMGFTIGLVVVVIVAAARTGWKLAPWMLGVGLIAWLLF